MMRRDPTLLTYETLACWYERCGQARKRDWFLVLAADRALTLGWPEEAERLRQQLLLGNPNHLLRPFDSFADALASPQVQSYIAYLRSRYPPERAEQLLAAEQAARAWTPTSPRGQKRRPSLPATTSVPQPFSSTPAPPSPRTPADPSLSGRGLPTSAQAGSQKPPTTSTTSLKTQKQSTASQASLSTPHRAPPAAPQLASPARQQARAEELSPAKHSPAVSSAQEEPATFWITQILFLLLLLVVLLLAGYILLGPLLSG